MKDTVRGMPTINFREFFQVKEAVSVAAMARNELTSEYIRSVKQAVRQALGQVGGLNARFIESLAAYFSWLYGMEKVSLDTVPAKFRDDWDTLGAYLTAYANDNALRSRLNSTSYSRTQITADSQRYHRQLAFSDRKFDKGPLGHVIVEVERVVYELFSHHPEVILSLPRGDQQHWAHENWTGWTWKSLGCGYSRAEGAAGGHCGNAGKRKGDNILSLRDAEDRVHLTFICNNGELGEMKGVGNTKPTSVYHPAICALLVSPYVKKVVGGGYMEEINFDLADLASDQLRGLVLSLLDKDHAVPENVRPPEYLSRFTQEMVDLADGQGKKEILRVVLNVFDDMGHSDSAEPIVSNLLFDLKALVLELVPSMKFRDLEEMWEKLTQIESHVRYENERRTTHRTEPKPALPEPVDDDLLLTVAQEVVAKASTLPRLIKYLHLVNNHSYKKPEFKEWVKEQILGLADKVEALGSGSSGLWDYIKLCLEAAELDHNGARYDEEDRELSGLGYSLASQYLGDGLRLNADEDLSDSIDSVWQAYLWRHMHKNHDISYTLDWDSHRAVWVTWDVRNVVDSEMSKAMDVSLSNAIQTSTHLINKRTLYYMRGKLIRAVHKMMRPAILEELSRRVGSALSDVRPCFQYDGNEGEADHGRYRKLYDGVTLLGMLRNAPARLVDDYVRRRHAIADLAKEVVQKHAKNAARFFRDNLDKVRDLANKMKSSRWDY